MKHVTQALWNGLLAGAIIGLVLVGFLWAMWLFSLS